MIAIAEGRQVSHLRGSCCWRSWGIIVVYLFALIDPLTIHINRLSERCMKIFSELREQ
jgi:hypothetical protein